MNRAIIFRAWDKQDRRMIVDEQEFIPCKVTNKGVLRLSPHHEENLWEIININRFDLMQYTGLLDKNGKEIYEGDLLRYPVKNEWDNKSFTCYEVFFHDNDGNSDYNIGFSINRCHHQGAVCGGYIPRFTPNTTAKMEIIGNIYENPELLHINKG